ncbi:hypothetical protein [Streptomyces sp. NPDC001068]|uniref:hypothetical protein n=1 Tax=Streptomyces sp. NPDC001068 TaxID=3364544 RepID=UPI0036A6D19A
MTEWAPTDLVRVDEDGDRSGASDGHSRYGVYLSQRLDEFHDYDSTDSPLTTENFAAAAWRVATPPVLIDYVVFRPDVQSIEAVWNENEDGDGSLAFKVSVPLRFDDLNVNHRPSYPWQDWTTRYDISTRDDKYSRVWEPVLKPGSPAVLTVANLLIPAADWDLPLPRHTRGRGLTDDAQQVVREVVQQINHHAGPMVARLLGEGRG